MLAIEEGSIAYVGSFLGYAFVPGGSSVVKEAPSSALNARRWVTSLRIVRKSEVVRLVR